MRVLDLDMDYFMTNVATEIAESVTERLEEDYYGDSVWSAERVRDFLENNLGLSKERKIPGKIVVGHNESLFFWKELIEQGLLQKPFEVVHVDSHADLGLGPHSDRHILDVMLSFPVEERPEHNRYVDRNGEFKDVAIGDYLLYAIAYRWIERIVYCGNPCGDCDDYLWNTLKNYHEEPVWDKPVLNTIQLLYNPREEEPKFDAPDYVKARYVRNSIKEPEVPLLIIPKVEDVHYEGDFDFALLAQSPNYTPASADFIMDIFREYIEEI